MPDNKRRYKGRSSVDSMFPTDLTASVNDMTGMMPTAPRNQYEADSYANLININPFGIPADAPAKLDPRGKNKEKTTDRRSAWNMEGR